MYTEMETKTHSLIIDRAMALHKMLRLLTISAGGEGYLHFMGNEFGHPEWIDFPREGNNNSYHYCRRQWSLEANDNLKYKFLGKFDKDMIDVIRKYDILREKKTELRFIHESKHLLAFEKGDLLFVFNLHPVKSYTDLDISVSHGCDYEVVFSSDDAIYGGDERVAHMKYSAMLQGRPGNNVRLYVPSRTAIVLVPTNKKK